jgi:uncharacterized phage-associated protein
MEMLKCLQKIDSVVLSDYILKHYGPMSHLKLQKLLFYCDAYCLAYFDEELITDEFEAWVHGPVSRKVYNSLKDKSVLYSDLTYSAKEGEDVDAEFKKLTQDQQDLISDILKDLSKWTGMELEVSTHKEKPWMEARKGYSEADKCNKLISKETTRLFYKAEINGRI